MRCGFSNARYWHRDEVKLAKYKLVLRCGNAVPQPFAQALMGGQTAGDVRTAGAGRITYHTSDMGIPISTRSGPLQRPLYRLLVAEEPPRNRMIDITDRCNDIDPLNRLDNSHSAATNYQPDKVCHRGNIPSGAGLLCIWQG